MEFEADEAWHESLEYHRVTLTLMPKRGPKRTILDGVSGEARAGRVAALMGPSGSGKTSLIHAVAGSLRSSTPCTLTGKVLVGGAPRGARRRLSVVGQDDALYPLFSVRETLVLAARLTRHGEDARAIADAALRRLGLAAVADADVGWAGDPQNRGVSGGERRRVSIGAELVASRGGILYDRRRQFFFSALAREVVRARTCLGTAGSSTSPRRRSTRPPRWSWPRSSATSRATRAARCSRACTSRARRSAPA